MAIYLLVNAYRYYRAGTWLVVETTFVVGVAAALCVEAAFAFAVVSPADDRLWAWFVRESSQSHSPSCTNALFVAWEREFARHTALLHITDVLLAITMVLAAAR